MRRAGVRLRGDLKTDIGYTSQREDRGINLMFYRARYFSPLLGRFLSADTIVPDGQNPQAFNRYAYVNNRPLNYIDPSGHVVCSPGHGGQCEDGGGLLGNWGGGGAGAGEAAAYVYSVLFSPLTVAVEAIDAAVSGIQCAQGDGWGCVAAALPFATGPMVRAGAKILGLVDNVPTGALENASDGVKAVENAGDALKAVENVGDGLQQLDNLPDDEILYQFSRSPDPVTGRPRGFPNEPRPGESAISCQIGSLCGNDPVQGFRQQMNGRDPGPGDLVRETTVGDLRHWGGAVMPDGRPYGPFPPGHGSITGNDWKSFKRIWRNERPLLPGIE